MFLDDPRHGGERLLSELVAAIEGAVDALGIEVVEERRFDASEWWMDDLTRLDVTKRLRRLERAIRMRVEERPHGPVDPEHEVAAIRLLTDLADASRATVNIGSLVLLKANQPRNSPAIVCGNLDMDQLDQLDADPSTLDDPNRVLEMLVDCNR